MTDQTPLAVILAAGKGTRMKSAIEKVLHPLAGAPLLSHAMATANAAGFERQAVIVGPGMERVGEVARANNADVDIFIQQDQNGTADAVLAARDALQAHQGDVIVLYGDTPLLRPATLGRLSEALAQGADLAVLGFEARDPAGYGRLITDAKGALIGIREDKDASAKEREITLCNSGVMAFGKGHVLGLLEAIDADNAKGEFYLTDAVGLAHAKGLRPVAVACEEDETLGVNTRAELAQAEAILQARLRQAAMAEGATMVAPETVYLSADTMIGRDVLIEPHVMIGPGVSIADGVTIKAFSHLEGASLEAGAVIGPFARLRPGAEIGQDARIGNFVEVKNAVFEDGAKANHLTYVGDARVGARANIGAGTITCNYDGFDKHRTEIGEGAFIGSNSSLIAPVKIGKGAYVGSGSAISKNVEEDALAVTRANQENRPEWAAKVRARRNRKR